MIRAYFLTNAILYLGLALLCTLLPAKTSAGIGYVGLNRSGQSEYLVIYGGIQVGLSLFYFFLSRDPVYFRTGVVFSLLLYAPIVAYRLATLAIYRPNSPVTLGTAALEVTLLIWAFLAWRKFP